ncbi:MAG TPA: FG-GAP-like repeat-containing protein [Vicinamibacterales bacterium]|nr:FG-GAP-like repeat-containing protein [Vicinamibacterales bacterium]
MRAATLFVIGLAAVSSCTRPPAVSDDTYRQAVTAFYVSLAGLQTSQDVIARRELERVTQLVPQEPAGWANLGLLLLRQQQLDEATPRLAKAAELAPRSAEIERMQALLESRRGNVEASIGHWRRALQLDANDGKAEYGLAQELERLGGPQNEADAQRAYGSLAGRTGNLAAQLEFARLAARRGDAAALRTAVEALARGAGSWPVDARERFEALRQAAQGPPTAAATPVIFLKNTLLRGPEYRAAFAAVSTPNSEVGEPLQRFLVLPNQPPQPAAPDARLAFAADASASVAMPGTAWAGAVWLTGDGAPAIVAVGPRELRVGSGAPIALPAGFTFASASPDAVVAADLNYDFRSDLVLAGANGVQILRQNANGGFAPVTAETRLPAAILAAPAHGAWAADVDLDGDLDVVVARRDDTPVVLRNNSDGTFAPQAPFGVRKVRGFVWADLDGEGVPDAVLLDDQGAVRVFLNQRGAGFLERAVPATYPRVAAIAAADLTGDGLFDVIGVASDGTVSRLSLPGREANFDVGRVSQFNVAAPLTAGTTRLLVADLDNNGAGDLLLATPDRWNAMLAGPQGLAGGSGGVSAGLLVTSAADLDGDGRLELVGRAADGARVVRTKGEKAYRWQTIRPRALTSTGDQRINSFGIGGEIEVRTGLNVQKQPIAAPAVHFGLGDASAAEVARITWPNGMLQSEFALASNASIGASQRLKGSCPWLFAWNGRDMGFVTDFIWRSPLGLKINAQATADVLMTEDWVRVRGDQLQPRNGEYDLRITAELWETHFFDLVSLMVVDHPQGTEMFVDERFAVPPPKLGAVATGPVQDLLAARDDRGRDVLDVVRARDDRHLDFAGRGLYQGVTRDHYVELELPESAPRTGPLWLVAQGWVHPTDTSVNVALGQGRHAPPAGLSLQIAGAAGRFKPARTGLGFPAGKDKTVLLDLSGVFPAAGPRRMRLGTNLEIFWDRIAWAAGRPDVTLQPRVVTMTKADLQYRGYSITEQKDASTPERPRYVLGGVAPRWRDLEGFHTRFGDVRELLQKVDDRYLIMNAGDELRLAFAEAPPPPPGFVRDFILVGDGWVKDGDYNTVASRTVLPLPTHRSPRYTDTAGRLEDDPVYREHPDDFARYHTRYVSPALARDALRAPDRK